MADDYEPLTSKVLKAFEDLKREGAKYMTKKKRPAKKNRVWCYSKEKDLRTLKKNEKQRAYYARRKQREQNQALEQKKKQEKNLATDTEGDSADVDLQEGIGLSLNTLLTRWLEANSAFAFVVGLYYIDLLYDVATLNQTNLDLWCSCARKF